MNWPFFFFFPFFVCRISDEFDYTHVLSDCVSAVVKEMAPQLPITSKDYPSFVTYEL